MAKDSGRGATWVAAGILLSRLIGLVRQKLFAAALGNSMPAAAFAAALRIPNFLQNLLGEGVLSASFIPIYAGLRGQKDDAGADKLAGGVFGMLALLVAALVGFGLLGAELMVTVVAPGFDGEARALTIRLVRIIFPGTGLLVMSAWCLGILNSHRRFFLSYAAPVMWNGAIIAALLLAHGQGSESDLAIAAGWGTVIGALLQFGVQLPNVVLLLGRFRPNLSGGAPGKEVVKNFGPAVASRGVVQVSSYLDTVYASLLAERAVSALAYAQTIAVLPVSLFGMAISAAELPELSAEAATTDTKARNDAIRARVERGLSRVAFFVVPSAAAFLFLGDLIAGILLEGGHFHAGDSRFVWYLLMGSSVGLLAQTMGRLYSSTFFAFKDTRTPLLMSATRVGVAAIAAFFWVRYLPQALGVPTELGAVGITATSGISAWLEYMLLRRALAKKIGDVGLPRGRVRRLWFAAFLAVSAAISSKVLFLGAWGPRPETLAEWWGDVLPAPAFDPYVVGGVTLGIFGGVYFLVASMLGIPQAVLLWKTLAKVLRRR
jgi:putative peptidoglycan lipid II flippase